MANYTAADVKRLRDLTGAGMLDSKNALVEAEGDFDKAVELLRIKGAKDVGKRAERATAEGLVAAKDGALIELNSETDFVAKNDEFQAVADQIVAAAAAAKAADVDALKAAKVGDTTVEQTIADLSAKIGEKLELRRAAYFDGTVETYLHKRAADLPPAVGVLVEYTGSDKAGRARGRAADRRAEGQVPDARRGARGHRRQRAAHRRGDRQEEGKPEQALPKIVEGRAQRVLQGRRAARPAVGVRQQEDRQGAARRGRRDRHPVRALRGRPGLTTSSLDAPRAGTRLVPSLDDRVSAFAFGDDALGDHDAVGLVDALRAGEVSAAELVEAAIARTEAVNPTLNGLAYRGVRPRAPARDAARPYGGYFDGVPSFFKDNVAVAGRPTMQGTDAWDPRPMPADGAFARVFLSTGLMPLGKTQMSEFGFSASAEHPRIGAVRNPWNPEHTAGASSSGSGAFVAAGVVPIAHANDGGGSIRIPAACNGLVGLKPTRGRLPLDKETAQMPLHLVANGVVTRSVRDTAAFLREAERVYRNPKLPPDRRRHPTGQAAASYRILHGVHCARGQSGDARADVEDGGTARGTRPQGHRDRQPGARPFQGRLPAVLAVPRIRHRARRAPDDRPELRPNQAGQSDSGPRRGSRRAICTSCRWRSRGWRRRAGSPPGCRPPTTRC